MEINSTTNSYSFKGYDARALRGFFMSTNHRGIADEMLKIGEKEGFDIFSPFGNKSGDLCAKKLPPKTKNIINWAWAQDYWTFTKNKLIALEFDNTFDSIREFFKLQDSLIQTNKRNNINKKYITDCFLHNTHISGGNIFIVKNGEDNEALVGIEELAKYSIDEIKKMYDVKKVIPLPPMDFHLDLFIRPLDNKRILLADDNMSLNIINQAYRKINKYISNIKINDDNIIEFDTIKVRCRRILDEMKSNIKNINTPQDTNIVEKILKNNGYEVIRVPGRIYTTGKYLNNNEPKLKHDCNFLNANALINKKGDLVYITNKSNIEKKIGLTEQRAKEIGINIEEEFIKSITPYIKREHIYFVDGDDKFISSTLLPKYEGGIHCVCSEIPY